MKGTSGLDIPWNMWKKVNRCLKIKVSLSLSQKKPNKQTSKQTNKQTTNKQTKQSKAKQSKTKQKLPLQSICDMSDNQTLIHPKNPIYCVHSDNKTLTVI